MTLRIVTAAVPAVLALLALPRSVAAQPVAEEQVTLTWSRGEGADGCPDLLQVERDVTARLGRHPFSPSAPRSLEVRVTRVAGQWVARIDERLAGDLLGTRTLPSEAPDCAALYSASVLVLALVIDAEAAVRPSPSPGVAPPPAVYTTPPAVYTTPPAVYTAPPSPAPASSPGPPAAAEPAPLTAPRGPWPRVTVHARAVAAFDVLPGTMFGPALSASVEGELLEGAAGMFFLPESPTPDGRFAFGLTAGWLGLCARPLRLWRASLGVCGAVQAGAFHSVVRALEAYEPLDPGDRPWAALTFSPQARLSILGPLSVELGLDVLVPLTRHASRAGDEIVFTEPAAGFLPFAGIGVSLP